MKNVINATTAGAIARQIIAEANKSANETAIKVTADVKKSAEYKKLLRLIKQKEDIEAKIMETKDFIAAQVTENHSIRIYTDGNITVSEKSNNRPKLNFDIVRDHVIVQANVNGKSVDQIVSQFKKLSK